MRRVLVVGAGFFGGLVARRLREVGVAPLVASRRGADLRMDAEDEASVASVLREGDVVVDTAGPFAARTTRLLRAAIERGCDVIDLSESLAWAEAVLALESRIRDAGVRVYPACSAVAAVAGACVRASGLSPTSIDLYLAPASAETASPATVRAFVASLGRPIRTFRDGRLRPVRGFVETRRFPANRSDHEARRSPHLGGLVESAAALLLPRSWPGLLRVEFWVDPNIPLATRLLSATARSEPLASAVRGIGIRVRPGPLGRRSGVFAVAVTAGATQTTFTLTAQRGSYLTAVEPAVMVAEALASGATPQAGVVLPHEQADPESLFERLRALGIAVAYELVVLVA